MRIGWETSIPENVIAAGRKDFRPSIEVRDRAVILLEDVVEVFSHSDRDGPRARILPAEQPQTEMGGAVAVEIDPLRPY